MLAAMVKDTMNEVDKFKASWGVTKKRVMNDELCIRIGMQ